MRARGKTPATGEVIRGRFGGRAPPPPELTERQQKIWAEVVDSEDPNFFATAMLRGLLVDYCRRRDASEGVSQVINAFKPEWLKSGDGAARFAQLLRLRDLETRGVVAIATKLRLTNQSRYTTRAAGSAANNAPKGPRPWEM